MFPGSPGLDQAGQLQQEGEEIMSDSSELDTRYVHGASCCWHGNIREVGSTTGEHPLPCCPHCGGVLFETPTSLEWWLRAQRYQDNGHPGYMDLLLWVNNQDRCWPLLTDSNKAYHADTGKVVPL